MIFPAIRQQTPFNKDFSFRYGNPFNDLPRLPGDKIRRRHGRRGQDEDLPTGRSASAARGIRRHEGQRHQCRFQSDEHRWGRASSIDYYWYAGEIVQKDGKTIATPVEFGATNLVGADLMLQTQFGLVGALIIEPPGTTWSEDTRLACVLHGHQARRKRLFRECVLVMQNMVARPVARTGRPRPAR